MLGICFFCQIIRRCLKFIFLAPSIQWLEDGADENNSVLHYIMRNLENWRTKMNNIMKYRTFLLIFIAVACIAVPLSAQLKRESLIFSEVYLNGNESDKSWLEIYNPTTRPLILEKFTFYWVLTPNVLPQEIREQGGIEISPGECVVLCANQSKFGFHMETRTKLVQVSSIIHFRKGGFFALGTKGLGEDGEDIFRYGDPEVTSRFKSQVGDFVVPFSKEAKSYTRIRSETHGQQFLPNFTQTEPSPGRFMAR